MRTVVNIQEVLLKYEDTPILKDYMISNHVPDSTEVNLYEQHCTDVYRECTQALCSSYSDLREVITLIQKSPLLQTKVASIVMQFYESPMRTEDCLSLYKELWMAVGFPQKDTDKPVDTESQEVTDLLKSLGILSKIFDSIDITKVFSALVTLAAEWPTLFMGLTIGDDDSVIYNARQADKGFRVKLSTDDEIVACAVKLGYPYNSYTTPQGASNYIKSIVPQIMYIDDKVIQKLGILAGQYSAKDYPDILTYMKEGYDKLIDEEEAAKRKEVLFNTMYNYFVTRINAIAEAENKEQAIIKFCSECLGGQKYD